MKAVFLDGTVENCGDDYSLKCNLSQFQQIDRYVYIKIQNFCIT